MDIIRNFNGMKLVITLTESEMKTALNEQERRYDHAEIRDILQQFKEESAFSDEYLEAMAEKTAFLNDVADNFYLHFDSSRPDREQMEEIAEHILERFYVTWAKARGILL